MLDEAEEEADDELPWPVNGLGNWPALSVEVVASELLVVTGPGVTLELDAAPGEVARARASAAAFN